MRIAILSVGAVLALTACGGGENESDAPDRSQVSETVMDNVDDLEGTISDDMIAIDDIRSQAPTQEDAAAANEDPEDSAASGETDDGDTPDAEPEDEESAE